MSIISCSACFTDEGLKIYASKIGIKTADECPNCKSTSGYKLDSNILQMLASNYFIRGGSFKTDYGGANAIQFNEHHFEKDTLNVPVWLEKDMKLIGQLLHVGFFHYGPRTFRVGMVSPLIDLQNPLTRNPVIERILNEFPKKVLPKGTYFYRLRKNPSHTTEFSQYDTLPRGIPPTGRMDSVDVPVLYGSQDLEVCIHECRVTVEDNLYVAKIVLEKDVELLDLSADIHEPGIDPHDSLNISVKQLFGAASHSYEIIREIAKAAYSRGIEGIIYLSYFNRIHASVESINNIGLFGRPIESGSASVECIDRVVLNKVVYDYSFGPASF